MLSGEVVAVVGGVVEGVGVTGVAGETVAVGWS